MDYVRPLTAAEQTSLQSKADRDGTTISDMLDAKIAQFLVDVNRDNGLDVDTQIAKKLSVKTLAEKESLLPSL